MLANCSLGPSTHFQRSSAPDFAEPTRLTGRQVPQAFFAVVAAEPPPTQRSAHRLPATAGRQGARLRGRRSDQLRAKSMSLLKSPSGAQRRLNVSP